MTKCPTETRDALFFGQLQEGLRLQLMRGPAVSGEKRLAELKKRQEYSSPGTPASPKQSGRPSRSTEDGKHPPRNPTGSQGSIPPAHPSQASSAIYYCGKVGHKMRDCRKQTKSEPESRGQSCPPSKKQVCTERLSPEVPKVKAFLQFS